jgi:hypothetical protein
MAVLGFASAENYGRYAAAVVRLPTTPSFVSAIVSPSEFLPTALAPAICVLKGCLNFILVKFVDVRHEP